MKQEIEPSHGDEVFTDPLTQNIVLQRRGIWKNYQPNRDLGIAPSLAEQLVAEDFPDHQIPPRFQFSHEYYQKIKDAKERMQAYRSIVVSSAVETGLEAEIQKDPWKFLHIPKNADAGYVRAAKIRLSQLWHPDKMDPRNPEKLKMIFQFSHDFPVSGYTWEQWIEELKDFESNPELIIEKSAEELAAMDADTYAQYEQQHQKQRDIEEKAAKIRDSMVTMANEKMSTINAAVKAANKKLGLTNEIFFDGYTWNQTTQKMWVPEDMESEVSKWFGGFAYTFLDLSLEGNGVIRKQNASEYTNKLIRAELEQPTLTFDYGEVYMMETNDYRQYVNLQAFFAWCELRMGQELAPSLLDGIVEMYDFNEHEREQLRQMLMNKESVDFILDTLRMDPDEGFALIRFVNAVEEGPTYSHFHGPSRESESYTLGVEFSQQGELILKYIHQANPYSMNMGWDEEARFTPTDVQLMQSVAYGPLLSA